MASRSPESAATAAPSTPAQPAWRRWSPFITAAVLVAYVLYSLDLQAFVQALQGTNYVLLFAFTLAFNLALLAADAFATRHVYRRTVAPVRYRELVVIRGVSYLPSLLNHHVGQAWLTYFLARAYRASIWRVAGATLLVYATTFGCLFLFGAAAVPFNYEKFPWLGAVLAVLAVLGLVYMLVVRLRPAMLANRPLLAPLFEVGVRGHLWALVLRIPHVVVLFIGNWVVFSFFGIQLPLTSALALVPPLMFVAALPITPQGLGTRDALALHLLAGHVAGSGEVQAASIAAATLCFAGALTAVQLVLAPLLWPAASRLLSRGEQTEGAA